MQGKCRLAFVCVVALTLLGMPVAAAADRARVEFIKAISPPDPFPDACGGTPPREPWVHVENEPALAVNPIDPDNLIAAWRQNPRVPEPPPDDAGAYTTDGGHHWKVITFPQTTRCTDPSSEYVYNSDPWLSFAADGQAYFASLPGRPGEVEGGVPGNPFETNTRLLVHRSISGGRTWADPVFVPPALLQEGRFQDKEVLAADAERPKDAYVIWMQLDDPQFAEGIMWFSRTMDGGDNWSVPRKLAVPGILKSPRDLLALVGRTLIYVYVSGNEADFVIRGECGASLPVFVLRSANGGDSWSDPVQLSDEHEGSCERDPETDQTKGNHAWAPDAGADVDGDAYVVWPDISSVDSSRILFSRSSDRGENWSSPAPVVKCECQTFKPMVAVMDDGTAGVVYYDDRNDKFGDEEWTVDVRFAYSRNGGRKWRKIHLAGPFDYRQPEGHDSGSDRHVYSQGHYQTMVALPNGFGAAFWMGRPLAKQGPTDIFFGRVGIGPHCRGRTATITGSHGGETLRGTKKADVIAARRGRDRILGLSGRDILCGGGGADRVIGGRGKDRLRGGKGADTLIGGRGRDRCQGGAGRDLRRSC